MWELWRAQAAPPETCEGEITTKGKKHESSIFNVTCLHVLIHTYIPIKCIQKVLRGIGVIECTKMELLKFSRTTHSFFLCFSTSAFQACSNLGIKFSLWSLGWRSHKSSSSIPLRYPTITNLDGWRESTV